MIGVHAQRHTLKQLHIYTHIHACIASIHACLNLHARPPACLHAYMRTYIHPCIRACMHTHNTNMHAYIHVSAGILVSPGAPVR